MNEKKNFTITDDLGIEKQYEILITFNLQTTGKDYIVYTDNTNDENGKLNIYASIFYPSDNTKTLDPIETDEEWNEVERLLQELNS